MSPHLLYLLAHLMFISYLEDYATAMYGPRNTYPMDPIAN